MMIKEILQVENAFQLVLMEEDGDTQISLTWNDLDQKRVEVDFCEACKTKKLMKTVNELVVNFLGGERMEDKHKLTKDESDEDETRKLFQNASETNVSTKLDQKTKKGVLFGDSVEDDWIWFENGNEKKDGKYVGEIRNGVPHGHGTLTFPSGEEFQGEFNDGNFQMHESYKSQSSDLIKTNVSIKLAML